MKASFKYKFRLIMLRLRISNIKSVNQLTGYCTLSKPEKWDLVTAVCIERKPQVAPQMNELQSQFNDQLIQIELEKSHKSPHEIRHEHDQKQLELLKTGDLDADMGLKQTAQDFVDMSLDELNKFKLGLLTTEADKKNDLKSINRKLTNNLVLLTQQKLGDKARYILPQDQRQDGETLRQCAERIIRDQVGNSVSTQIYGNAPSGFYKYRYPKASQNSAIGAKVFFYFARHISGDLDKKVNHKWLDRTELEKELPEKYHKSIQQFLIDE